MDIDSRLYKKDLHACEQDIVSTVVHVEGLYTWLSPSCVFKNIIILASQEKISSFEL